MTSASEAKDQDRRLDSTLELDVASVSVGSDAFGPQRMAVSVDNLDVASWNAFSSAMTDLQAMTVKAGAGGGASCERQMEVMQRGSVVKLVTADAGWTDELICRRVCERVDHRGSE